MAGFTLSGGFHFDPTGEGVAPAGITARGMGGMTFTPPPPPPPSFEAYTYQAIERVQYHKEQVGSTNYTKTVTNSSYGGGSNQALQENDVMIVAVQATSTNYSEPPAGWTQIEGAKRNAIAIPGYGIAFNAYYKVCDDSTSHTYEAGALASGTGQMHMLAYRNLRVTGGPETSPIGVVNTSYSSGSETYPEMDLHQYNNTATSDDDTSWVLFFGQHEFGHRTLYGPSPSGGSTNILQNYNVTKRYTAHEARNQTEDVAAYTRYISSNTVWYAGSPKNPPCIGIGIELMARPGHSGGAWNTGLNQPE